VLYFVICFLLGNSPASNANSRRFGTLYQFHLHRQVDEVHFRVPKRRLLAFDAGELPKRKHITYRTRQKLKIKNVVFSFISEEAHNLIMLVHP